MVLVQNRDRVLKRTILSICFLCPQRVVNLSLVQLLHEEQSVSDVLTRRRQPAVIINSHSGNRSSLHAMFYLVRVRHDIIEFLIELCEYEIAYFLYEFILCMG